MKKKLFEPFLSHVAEPAPKGWNMLLEILVEQLAILQDSLECHVSTLHGIVNDVNLLFRALKGAKTSNDGLILLVPLWSALHAAKLQDILNMLLVSRRNLAQDGLGIQWN